MVKKIGILTGGGDAPGLNGIIETVVRALSSTRPDLEIIGIHDGFEGIFKQKVEILTSEKVFGAHSLAGTLLGTSNKSTIKNREEEFIQGYKSLSLDGLLACGGDGTFSALSLVKDFIPLVGVPKTIDNDLQGTDLTFGYDTACTVVSESVDSLRATADAHQRVMIVETMGRTTGWIALGGGMASMAEVVLIPERPYSKEKLKEYLRVQKKNKRGLVIVIAEGAHAQGEDTKIAFHVKDAPQSERYGGVGQALATWIQSELDWESRAVVLGHLQRSRHPTHFDVVLTLKMGMMAANLIQHESWNQAVVSRQGNILAVPVAEIMGEARLVSTNHESVKILQQLGSFV